MSQAQTNPKMSHRSTGAGCHPVCEVERNASGSNQRRASPSKPHRQNVSVRQPPRRPSASSELAGQPERRNHTHIKSIWTCAPYALLRPTLELTDWRRQRATNGTKTKLESAMTELDAPAPVQWSDFVGPNTTHLFSFGDSGKICTVRSSKANTVCNVPVNSTGVATCFAPGRRVITR